MTIVSVLGLPSNPNSFLIYNPQTPVKRFPAKQLYQAREHVQDVRFVQLPQA